MIEARTHEVAQTEAIAAVISTLCRPGDLLVLVGELGAGKTAFTRGFATALGAADQVTSPTFTLANEYRGRMRIHHLDAYRIGHLDEVRDLALPELLDDDAVTLIEWGDTIAAALPNDYLEVRLAYGDVDAVEDRDVTLRCVGDRWSARSRALCSALADWVVTPC